MTPGLQRAERRTRQPLATGYAPSTGLMRPPSRSLTFSSRDYAHLYRYASPCPKPYAHLYPYASPCRRHTLAYTIAY